MLNGSLFIMVTVNLKKKLIFMSNGKMIKKLKPKRILIIIIHLNSGFIQVKIVSIQHLTEKLAI